jgi:hypothetical protein
MNLVLSKLQANLSPGINLKCVWFPSRTLPQKELAHFQQDVLHVNEAQSKLDYGFFARDATPQDRKRFLENSIWCVVYARGTPIGFVYNYYVGEHAKLPIIHSGLVHVKSFFGKEFIKIPYAPLALGNLVNFGPHYISNISHVPVIIELFDAFVDGVYPACDNQNTQLRAQYRPVLQQLKQNYIIPILKYQANLVDDRRYTITNSMRDNQAGFNKQWETIPKATSFVCNQFVKEWLSVKADSNGEAIISDDLIQIGQIDFSVFGKPQSVTVINKLKFANNCEFTGSIFDRLTNSLIKRGA